MVAIFIARKCREKGVSMMSEGKTIGQLMEEMRAKAGAQNYHGHDIWTSSVLRRTPGT